MVWYLIVLIPNLCPFPYFFQMIFRLIQRLNRTSYSIEHSVNACRYAYKIDHGNCAATYISLQ